MTELVANLLTRTDDPGDVHICPICGGILHTQFEPYKRNRRDLLGVIVKCDHCGISVGIDFDGSDLPSWLEER